VQFRWIDLPSSLGAFVVGNCAEKCSARQQPKFQSDVMGGLYLGIAITGVEALIAFM